MITILSYFSVASAQSKSQTLTDSNSSSVISGEVEQCRYFIRGRRFSAAAIELSINSRCRKHEIVSIDYEGYTYRTKLNEYGIAELPIFLTKPSADATIQFEHSTPVSITLTSRELRHLDRVILAWNGAATLDLHTLEFGATLNSSTDIWRKNACERSPHKSAAGSLYCFRGVGDNAMNLQVYTHKRTKGNQNKRRGIIDFRIDFFDRGSRTKAPFCGNTPQAKIHFITQRISKGRAGRIKKQQMLPADCGTTLTSAVRYARGFIRHITIR